MDIAKIRKKIKEEKEKTAEGTPEATTPQESESRKGEEKPVEETGVRTQSAEITGEKSEDRPEIVSQETFGAPTVKKESIPDTAAKAAKPEEIFTDIIELLTFRLSTEEFAFRVNDIEEILRFQRITVVPKVPDYILGITSLRGKIIPVTDLKKRLSIKSREEIDESRKKILILKGSKGPFGAVIDKVNSVIRISPSEIVEPPAHLSEAELIFIEGVVLHNSRFISVIRIEEVSNINLKLKE